MRQILENPIWAGLFVITVIGILFFASYLCDAAWRIWNRMLGIADD